jgi:hypothetical protein
MREPPEEQRAIDKEKDGGQQPLLRRHAICPSDDDKHHDGPDEHAEGGDEIETDKHAGHQVYESALVRWDWFV